MILKSLFKVADTFAEVRPVPDETRIHTNYEIINKFFPLNETTRDRPLSQIDTLVIHHTEGGDGIFEWMENPGEPYASSYRRGVGFTQFYNERNGKLSKLFPMSKWSIHSSAGRGIGGWRDRKTLGVENVHYTGLFKQEQYESLAFLIDYIKFHCPNLKKIVGHDHHYRTYSGGEKGCPSHWFDWNALDVELRQYGYTFNQYDKEAFYLISG